MGSTCSPQRPPVPLWRRVAAQLRDPLIIVLLVAALIVATGDSADTAVIMLVIVVNTSVRGGAGGPHRTGHHGVVAVQGPAARVIRDASRLDIPAAESLWETCRSWPKATSRGRRHGSGVGGFCSSTSRH
ncbi:MAG TPA: cation-transporting P-type ATPase [Nonomuraea sp.]|nr:cation-transporting P-type ATPase [Nonomuraea sp.]